MKAEIIGVGTELTSGDSLNTNSKYIASKLFELGIDIDVHISVKDDKELLRDISKQSVERSDIVIYTGGLGPTEDDFTKEVVAETLGKELLFSQEVLDEIEGYFKKRDKAMSQNNRKQAYIIEDSVVLRNEIGTAPGYFVKYGDKSLVLLPGPPKEMRDMFVKEVYPLLKVKDREDIYTKLFKTIGVGESQVEESIKEVMKNYSSVEIATYANLGEVKVKLTSRDKPKIQSASDEIHGVLKENIYSFSDMEIEESVFKNLKKSGLKVGFCESCTGGLVTSKLARFSGASEVLDRSVITYSNKAKMAEADVKYDTIKKHGAVSCQVAEEMAEGLFKKSDIDISVSITGIAGPDGGSDKKPVGLVYICVFAKDYLCVEKHVFVGDRVTVQDRASKEVYNCIRKHLLSIGKYSVL